VIVVVPENPPPISLLPLRYTIAPLALGIALFDQLTAVDQFPPTSVAQ
jgi:hypothetical protein